MNPALLPISLAATLAAALPAQITVSATTVAPATLIASSGSTVITDTLSLAAATSNSGASAVAIGSPGLSIVTNSWLVDEDPLGRSREFTYSFLGTITAGAPGLVSVAYHEVVIELSSPTPRDVELEFDDFRSATAGQGAPLLDVDLGDDGTVETNLLTQSITLGPTPYRIRLFCQGSASSSGATAVSMRGSFEMTMRPDNDLATADLVSACFPIESYIFPSFNSSGFEFRVPFENDPVLAVIGFTPAPVVLPALAPLPCILYPAADVVLALPQGVAAAVDIPLPPSVRPATLYVQGVRVDFTSSSLFTTTGYIVAAQ